MSTPKTPPTSVPAVKTSTGYQEKLQDPLKGQGGRINSPFGPRVAPKPGASTFHKGTDIKAPEGTPVYAAASGIVEFAGVKSGYGNYIKIRHDNKTETAYAHLSIIYVRANQRVTQGEIIGKVGHTGNVTGNHLHYEVIENGTQINPNGTGSVAINANDRSAAEKGAKDRAEGNGTKEPISPEYKEAIFTLAYNQDEIIRQLLTGEHFKDNEANNFYNLTYHWRFFTTVDTEFATQEATTPSSTVHSFYEELNKYEQVVLAETGVTAFNIDSVTMEAFVGTDYQTSSSTFTSFEMKITEPNGAIFLDALRNAALKLGVRNYNKTFYYLELTFKGYDEDGEPSLTPFADLPNGGRWIWGVCITDIQVNMAAGGGTYTLQLNPMNDTLSIGKYNLVPTTIDCKAGTVGEFFDSLTHSLNVFWAKMMGSENIITYEVQFHPVAEVMTVEQVRAMSIKPKDEEHNEERSVSFGADRSAQVPKGITISQTLDAVMKSCEAAQHLALDVVQDGVIDTANNGPNANGYRQSILWRIEPEVHFPDYDPVFNDYCRKFVIHIYGFRNHAAVLSPMEARQKEEVQKAIITDMAHRNFLPKKYEYLFTGANSEVLDLDLTYNLNWSALLPRLSDATQEQAETHAKALPDDVKNNQKPSPARRADGTPKTKEELGVDLRDAGGDYTAEAEKYRDMQKHYDANDGTVSLEDLKKQAKIVNDLAAKVRSQGRVVSAYREAYRQARPATKPSTSYEREYAEDLAKQKSDITNPFEYREATPITIETFDPDNISGVTGQYHAGKSIYGAVLEQVYGPITKQFFQIEMTVRGDPFWIGPGTFEQLIIRKNETFVSAYPNYQQGVNAILLKFMYPLGQDDNGELLLNTNETVTGIYQINKVSHRFDDGKFTQVLKAYRVPIIDLYKALYKNLYPNENTTAPTDGEPQSSIPIPPLLKASTPRPPKSSIPIPPLLRAPKVK